MKKKGRPQRRPRVEYTISLTWTVAGARRWWKKNGTLNDASFKEFEEELENEAVFGEFVQDLHVTGFGIVSVDLVDLDEEDLRLRYFEWVAGTL